MVGAETEISDKRFPLSVVAKRLNYAEVSDRVGETAF
jgi:hypothetical protein